MFNIERSNNIKEVITKAFALDESLLSKWHVVSGSGLESCAQNTTDVLKNESHSDFEFFTISDDETFVGYFGKEANGTILSTFFIAPNYRPKKDQVWETICSNMTDKFSSGVYNKNKPAIKFFEKKGSLVDCVKMPNGHASIYAFGNTE